MFDSPLEEAVRSEPVSEKPNSLFFRENTGYFIVYGPTSEDLGRKANPNQLLTHKFPTGRNRELIWTYEGIKSRHQGKSPQHQGKRYLNSRGQKGDGTVEHGLKRACSGRFCQSWFHSHSTGHERRRKGRLGLIST